MTTDRNIYRKIDWLMVICYLLLIIFGWLNIYASSYSDESASIFSLDQRSGMQLLWIGVSFAVICLILFVINPRFYFSFTWWFYLAVVVLLIAVLVIGKEVNGSKSWIALGGFRFQPSEFSKITTSLALASIIGKYNFKISNLPDLAKVLVTIFIPMGLIILEPDAGTMMVYCGFVFMLFREGLTGWIISFAFLIILLFVVTLKFDPGTAILVLLGIYGILKGIVDKRVAENILLYGVIITALAFIPRLLSWEPLHKLHELGPHYFILFFSVVTIVVSLIRHKRGNKNYSLRYLALTFACSVLFIFSVQLIFNKVLKEHHRDRIENLLGITQDLKGAGYNVHQSKIAIGSGGLLGKGYLQGTQTKFKFVPEQSTDFIFCTIGEEWGFVGSVGLLIVFFTLIFRIISNAEKHTDRSIRVYGYCVACCLFMHVFINVAMTIGLFPVVGIPLPFISYGGTSFLSFSTLLFIFIRLDLERWK
ncbi:MAG: rod shape-determining protein RodA [Bacteroidales bacterium]|nr:rod shape-determining protein RodA [Bacteroidales bacterium]MBR2298897.1 rod shape-determining protein RodA [Bacteroidales bacterium]